MSPLKLSRALNRSAEGASAAPKSFSISLSVSAFALGESELLLLCYSVLFVMGITSLEVSESNLDRRMRNGAVRGYKHLTGGNWI